MSSHLYSDSIISEQETRNSLWKAICDAAIKLSGQCGIYTSKSPDKNYRVQSHNPVPDIKTWQMLEGLNILAILLKSEKIVTDNVCNIFGQTGPIQFVEDGGSRYLWAQPTIHGHESELSGRPDIVILSTPDEPSALNTLRVVESKCCRHIGAQQIRAEFGKAHDLKVTSYFIWSYYTPSPKAISGARKLGLDLVALGFDTEMGKDFSLRPEFLLAHVANTLEMSKQEQRFAKAITGTSKDIMDKALKGGM